MISTVYLDPTAAYQLLCITGSLKKSRRDVGGGEVIQPKLKKSSCNYEIGEYALKGSIMGNLSAAVCRDYSL